MRLRKAAWGAALSFSLLPLVSFPSEPRPLPGNPKPAYPEKARYAYIAGDVWFRASVGADGSVQSVEITRVPYPNMGFEEAVIPVIREWRFEPALSAGVARAAVFEGNVRFNLRPDDEDAIRAVVERSALAWGRGNAQVIASHFADEAHIHTVTEDIARGPYQIRERFGEFFSGRFKDTRVTVGVDMIRFFARDRAEVEQTYEIQGGAFGTTVGRVTATFHNRTGEWLIDHARLSGSSGRFWDTDPVLEHKPPDPPYPEEARRNGVRGRVVMEILVLRDGATEVVEVLEDLPHGCVEAALENARSWRWKPALRGGQPVEASGEIWFAFPPPVEP